MALVLYWYSYICVVVVVLSYIGSAWIIWSKDIADHADLEDNDTYEGLLASESLSKNHVCSSQLWSCCWRGLHPAWLFVTRICSFLVMAGFLAWDIDKWGLDIFVYYTEWTYALVMLYFLIGAVVSAYGCWLTSKGPVCDTLPYLDYQETGNSYLVQCNLERAGFWGYLMQCIYQTCAGAAVLTDVVFWCIIVPFASNVHLAVDALMGCMHTINIVFLLIETGLNSLPFPWFRLAYFVQWTCIYVVFQWILHAFPFEWWPYPFLKLDSPWSPLWYISFGLFLVPCYGLYFLIVKAKRLFFPRWFPHSFVGYK